MRINYSWLSFILLLLNFCVVEPLLANQCNVCSKSTSSICTACQVEHYCSPACQKKDWPQHKISCSKYSPYKHLAKGVAIKQSSLPNAGSGVFAEKDMEKNQEVGAYFGKIVDLNSLQGSIENGWSPYAFPFCDQAVLGASAPPAAHLAMQIANDPYVTLANINMLANVDCNDLKPAYLEQVEQFVRNYVINLKTNRHNIESISIKRGIYPVFIAKRDIAKGEELFLQYGPQYWAAIPMMICHRKGKVLEAFKIQKSLYLGVKAAGEDPSLFGCMGLEILNHQIESFKKYHSSSRLSSIIANGHTFAIGFTGPTGQVQFDDLAREYGLSSRLDEIARVANEEFYDGTRGIRAHPSSKQLLSDFIAFLKTKNAQNLLSLLDVSSKPVKKVSQGFYDWLDHFEKSENKVEPDKSENK